MPVTVRIPTPLRAVTKGNADVQAKGDTVDDLIGDLERQFPGLRDRLVDETGELRRFVNIYVNQEDIRFLREPRHAPEGRRRGRDRARHRRRPLSPRPHLRARPGVHRVGHPRDDPRGEPARRRQPRPGHAELPAAAGARRGGPPRPRRRLPPVRDHLGRAQPAPGHRRQVPALLRHGGRSRAPRHRLLRLDRDDAVDAAGRPEPRRRGHRLRAVLRELRARAASSRARCRSGCRSSRRTSRSIPTAWRGR